MKKTDCIIIGAGLSGLACALTLQKNGLNSVVYEAGAEVGGRVKSHKTSDGFILDEGFQVILNSYPELKKFVDVSKLNLKYFNSGAMIFDGAGLELLGNPVLHPEISVSMLFKDLISMKDKALLVKLLFESQFYRTDSTLGALSTEAFLNKFGFSDRFVEFFWRPFLTGVYLDSKLQMPENFFKFLIRCFSTGRVSIPEKGMIELPLQMARKLPKESILLNQKVSSWDSKQIILATGKSVQAKKIICAFDPTTSDVEFNKVVTHYFTGAQLSKLNWNKWLVLLPNKLGMQIDHMCLLSAVSESYGNGKPLLSVSVVGNKGDGVVEIEQIKQEVNQIANFDLQLEHLSSFRISKALPRFSIETASLNQGFSEQNGVLYCGDRWASPSINGALRSGRLAAEQVIQELKC